MATAPPSSIPLPSGPSMMSGMSPSGNAVDAAEALVRMLGNSSTGSAALDTLRELGLSESDVIRESGHGSDPENEYLTGSGASTIRLSDRALQRLRGMTLQPHINEQAGQGQLVVRDASGNTVSAQSHGGIMSAGDLNRWTATMAAVVFGGAALAGGAAGAAGASASAGGSAAGGSTAAAGGAAAGGGMSSAELAAIYGNAGYTGSAAGYSGAAAAGGAAAGSGGSAAAGGGLSNFFGQNAGRLAGAAVAAAGSRGGSSGSAGVDGLNGMAGSSRAIADQISSEQLSMMQFANQQAREEYARRQQHFVPIENRLASEAMTYDTPERRAEASARAAADVEANSGRAQADMRRALARRGGSMDDGASVSMMGDMALGTARARSSATDRAVRNVEGQGYARMMDAAGIGRGVFTNQATQQQIGNSSANTAGNAYNAPANIYATAARMQNEQDNSDANDAAAWGRVIGGIDWGSLFGGGK